jgi:CheY-like chemotaxis protein
MLKKLPLFYFPLTICWIDDDQLFLDAANNLFKEDYNCITFINSKKAIEFLINYRSPYEKINLTRELTESDIYNVHNHLPIDIDISKITQLANTLSIKNELGILIIDNNMPYMNGIDICHQLKDSGYKKILLTGQTNPIEVIDAFNNGIIDKFIGKDKNIAEKLKKDILKLSYQYFYDKTRYLLTHIETSQLSPLSDEIFIDFFYHWFESNQGKEFYLINKHGSFLIKDKYGLSIYFIVMSEHAKNEFLKLNDDALDKIGNLLEKLSSGESIPFFGIGKECWEFKYEEWNHYFYPSQIIHGREKYYWTIIKDRGVN